MGNNKGKNFKKPYQVFTITLISEKEHFEEHSDNIIEFIKKLKGTDILNFDYNPINREGQRLQ